MSGATGERHTLDPGPSVVVFAPRERTRTFLRQRLPRRRGRVAFTRSADEMASHFRRAVVDVAIIDVGSAGVECERAIGLAREFPSAGFLALSGYRVTDAAMLARSAELDFADLLAEGVDDPLLPVALHEHGYTPRFARLHDAPPDELGIAGTLRRQVWRCIVAQAGRPVQTGALASVTGLSREHLSRSFARDGSPNLKRIIDLVRLLSAAELAKNPGYDVSDVARVLGYASSSHLSASAQRLLSIQGSSLAALGASELIGRFVLRGGGRQGQSTAGGGGRAEGGRG